MKRTIYENEIMMDQERADGTAGGRSALQMFETRVEFEWDFFAEEHSREVEIRLLLAV